MAKKRLADNQSRFNPSPWSAMLALKSIWRQAAGLFPVVKEAVSADMYRLGGKIHFFVFLMVIVIILISLKVLADSAGMPFFIKFQTFVFPLCLTACGLAFFVWKFAEQRRVLRYLTFIIILLDIVGTLASAWVTGPIQSHITSLYFALIVTTRALYGFRLGIFTLVSIVGGVAIILILQDLGAISAMPLAPKHVHVFYGDYGVQWIGFAYMAVMLCATFIAANWTIVTLRFRGKAIRLLRASLSATQFQKVGEHTGRVLNDTYRVDEFIGRGGMGEIYAGEHLRTKRKVAIKLLHPYLLEDPNNVKRFKMEAEITGRLDSEYIVKILDVNEDHDDLFIILELLEGIDVNQRIAAGPLELEEVSEIIAQAAQGLASAHAAEIVHRDLKPSNLFLVNNPAKPQVKLLDFGISKILGNTTLLTQQTALMGTPQYMSPEQIQSNMKVSPRTDQFALACIAYHCLTGKPPFEGDSLSAICTNICRYEPQEISDMRVDCPPGVGIVLGLAMAKDPHHRFTSVLEFATEFKAAISGNVSHNVIERSKLITRGLPFHAPEAETATGDPLLATITEKNPKPSLG